MGCGCSVVEANEYLVADRCTNRWVVPGPQVACLCCASHNRKKKIMLRADQYLIIRHPISRDENVLEHVAGPAVYIPDDAFASVEGPFSKVELTINEYIIAEDGLTKEKRTIEGPALITPQPYETFGEKKQKISLTQRQYVHLKDTLTGEYRVEKGAKTFSPSPSEEVGQILELIFLEPNQYVKIANKRTSEMRIVTGPVTISLLPFEEIVKEGGKLIQDAVVVDAEHAVLVQNIVTGQQTLIREPQRYIPPDIYTRIVERRDIIKLAPYECVAVQNREGIIRFISGATCQAFFLEPFCKVVSQTWTSDTFTGSKEDLWRFDTRPRNVKFLLKAQSSENISFSIHMTVLWQILDLSRLFASPDPVLDLVNHIRSQILSVVSRMTTQELISHSTQELLALVNQEDPEYYTALGIRLLRVNVTEKTCENKKVEGECFSLIQQKIENETRLLEIKNQISVEEMRSGLLRAEMENVSLKTKTEGQSEGGKIAEFFESLGDMPLEMKKEIYEHYLRTLRIEMISKNGGLSVTPQGADILLIQGTDSKNISVTPKTS